MLCRAKKIPKNDRSATLIDDLRMVISMNASMVDKATEVPTIPVTNQRLKPMSFCTFDAAKKPSGPWSE